MKLAAHLSHHGLHTPMFALPLLGWGMMAAGAYPVIFYGAIEPPSLLPQRDTLHALLWNADFYLAFAFFTLVVAHVAAALFHALVPRNGVVEAMAPVRSQCRRRSRATDGSRWRPGPPGSG